MNLRQLQQEIKDWSRSKGWYSRDVPVPESIALLHTELSEMMERHREGFMPHHVWYSWEKDDGAEEISTDPFMHGERDHMGKPEGIGPEIADLIIRALDFCGRYQLDAEDLVAEKMAHNNTRPYRHDDKVA